MTITLCQLSVKKKQAVSFWFSCSTWLVFVLTGKSPSVRSLSEYSEYPVISKADIENHNKDEGMWVIIDGRVYNLETFLATAPCGSDTLRALAGKFYR